jgi:hypothetical protein
LETACGEHVISSSPLATEDHIEYMGLTLESLWRRDIRVMTGNDYGSCSPQPAPDPWGLCPSEWAWLMSTSSPHLTGALTHLSSLFLARQGARSKTYGPDKDRMHESLEQEWLILRFANPPFTAAGSVKSVLSDATHCNGHFKLNLPERN